VTTRSPLFTIESGAKVSLSGLTFSIPTATVIANQGDLTVQSIVISQAAAGIDNCGTLLVDSSTIAGSATAGIDNESGSLTVINSTVSGNANDGIDVLGGTASLTSCTVSSNKGYGISCSGGVTIYNTLVAGNGGIADVIGAFTSLGHNLIGVGDYGSGFASNDLVGTSASPIDPKLGMLANNGGPTPTMALLSGSPALDAGGDANAPAADQRGVARPQGTNVDIGAFELPVPISFNLGTLPAGVAGASYRQIIAATGGSGAKTISYTITSGTISAGLTFTAGTDQLAITGTPAAGGTVTFQVTATDAAGAQNSRTFTLTVSPAASSGTPPGPIGSSTPSSDQLVRGIQDTILVAGGLVNGYPLVSLDALHDYQSLAAGVRQEIIQAINNFVWQLLTSGNGSADRATVETLLATEGFLTGDLWFVLYAVREFP
jgi:hypothetical protein